MFYIRFQFPAGRYHATPWGSHVNEGDVEWPPSPWRLLRGLLSVGFTHLQWSNLPDEAESLVNKLSGCHPAYALPAGVPVHTRHYMPVHEGTRVKSAKVFDTSIRVIDGQSLWMRFDVELSDTESSLFNSLIEHLPFLGRAESWVDAELLEFCEDDADWIEPSDSASPTLNARLVRVLSTQRIDDYWKWRAGAVVRASRSWAATKGKEELTVAQQKKLELSFPQSISECLLASTSSLQSAGWSQPPGSLWIDYTVPQPQRVSVESQRQRRVASARPEMALLSLSSDSVRGKTLPHESVSVFVGENLHKACVRKIAKLTSDDRELATFTGRDQHGKLLYGHRHAHFLSLCLQGDRKHIDHILVFAREGFGPMAQRAIAEVDAIYAAGLPKTWVTLLGFGNMEQVQRALRATARRSCDLFSTGRRFRSVTPFVASRHLKPKNNKYTLEDNLADECRFRNLPSARITNPNLQECRNRGRFRIARIGAGRQPPQGEGWFLEIEFAEALCPAQLPLTLGYGSHFGVGLFEAVSKGT